MAAALQTADHVCAHPPQTDHSNLHLSAPISVSKHLLRTIRFMQQSIRIASARIVRLIYAVPRLPLLMAPGRLGLPQQPANEVGLGQVEDLVAAAREDGLGEKHVEANRLLGANRSEERRVGKECRILKS